METPLDPPLDIMPKGIRLNRNLPNGVMKVVSLDDCSLSSTCQKPEFASSFEKINVWHRLSELALVPLMAAYDASAHIFIQLCEIHAYANLSICFGDNYHSPRTPFGRLRYFHDNPEGLHSFQFLFDFRH